MSKKRLHQFPGEAVHRWEYFRSGVSVSAAIHKISVNVQRWVRILPQRGEEEGNRFSWISNTFKGGIDLTRAAGP